MSRSGYVPLERAASGASRGSFGGSFKSESSVEALGQHAKHGGHEHKRPSLLPFLAMVCLFGAVVAAVFDEPMSINDLGPKPASAPPSARMRGSGIPYEAKGPPSLAATAGVVQRKFQFEVPSGVKAGDLIHVLVPGSKKLMSIRLPEGAVPGQEMMIEVPNQELSAEAPPPAAGDKPAEGEGAKEEGGGGKEEGEEVRGEQTIERIAEDAHEMPVELEDLLTVHGEESFWRHWYLCVLTVCLGVLLIAVSCKGVFYGFGPLDVDPRKLPDHPCRFQDPMVMSLAQAHMEHYGDCPDTKSYKNSPRSVYTKSAHGSSKDVIPKVTPRGKSPLAATAAAGAARLNAAQSDKAAQAHAAPDWERDAPMEDEEQGEWYEVFKSTHVLMEVYNRGRWLLVLLLFQSTSSIVLASFEDLIKKHLTLTLFLTMLVGAGGNAGAQSVVKDISMISSGHTPASRNEWRRAWSRTIVVALYLSIGLGMAAFVRVITFAGSPLDAWAIALSCCLIVFSAVLVGTALPFAMIWCGFDPLHSGAVIQVMMDIWGVIVSCVVCSVLLST